MKYYYISHKELHLEFSFYNQEKKVNQYFTKENHLVVNDDFFVQYIFLDDYLEILLKSDIQPHFNQLTEKNQYKIFYSNDKNIRHVFKNLKSCEVVFDKLKQIYKNIKIKKIDINTVKKYYLFDDFSSTGNILAFDTNIKFSEIPIHLFDDLIKENNYNFFNNKKEAESYVFKNFLIILDSYPDLFNLVFKNIDLNFEIVDDDILKTWNENEIKLYKKYLLKNMNLI